MNKIVKRNLILVVILIISACSSFGGESDPTVTPISLPDISGPEQFPKRAVIITLTPDTRSCNTLSTSIGRYFVKPGDTLESIALRFNKSIEELQRDNCLTSLSVQAGQQLIVPFVLDNQSNVNNAAGQSESASQTTAPNPTVPCMPNEEWQGFYVVQAGDTLSSIAKRHNLSVSELMTANCVSLTFLLMPGDILIVPYSIPATTDSSD